MNWISNAAPYGKLPVRLLVSLIPSISMIDHAYLALPQAKPNFSPLFSHCTILLTVCFVMTL